MLDRRISANILLTIYALVENTTTTAATTESASTGEPASTIPGETTVVDPFSTVTSNGVPIETLYSTQTVEEPAGNTITTTLTVATTVTAVTYTTVDLKDPGSLAVTEVFITIEYHPCPICANNGVPPIEWTTTEAHCEACGSHGEDVVTLTVPKTGFCTPETAGEQPVALGQWLQYAPDSYANGTRPTLPVETTVCEVGFYQPTLLSPSGTAGPATGVFPAPSFAAESRTSSEAPQASPTSPVTVAGGNKEFMQGLRLLLTVAMAIVFTIMLL